MTKVVSRVLLDPLMMKHRVELKGCEKFFFRIRILKRIP